MANNIKNLEKLVSSLFYPKEPSPLFVESLYKYTKPNPSIVPDFEQYLWSRSEKAYLIYKKLPNNENYRKLAYILLCLSSKRPVIESEVASHIKQGALGIEISYFNPILLPELKSKINYALYSIVTVIYTHGLIYKQLKMEMNQPSSITHKNFLNHLRETLKEYEDTVISSDYDLFNFYSKCYKIFKKIKKLGQLNEIFKTRNYLYYKSNQEISNTLKTITAYNPIVKGYEDILFKVYNDCTISYLLTGSFEDPYDEFFIKNHILDYGLIPSFISKQCAETIGYIGRYTAFLKSINSLNISSDIQKIIKKIDLSKRSAASYLRMALHSLNAALKEGFIIKYSVLKLLHYIHSTFLFGRGDFVEKLFISLKESRKRGKKNILNLLENCLESSFPESQFNSLIDIYISNEESESFSLYIKLSYPISLLIEEEFTVKLIYVFKFLWKLKKIDHLTRRLNNRKYFVLVQKMMFYVFNEVIGEYKNFDFNEEEFAFDEFKMNLNVWLDNIIKRLFINLKGRKIEMLLYNMERAFISMGNGEPFDEENIKRSLDEFYQLFKKDLVGTYLFDLEHFVS